MHHSSLLSLSFPFIFLGGEGSFPFFLFGSSLFLTWPLSSCDRRLTAFIRGLQGIMLGIWSTSPTFLGTSFSVGLQPALGTFVFFSSGILFLSVPAFVKTMISLTVLIRAFPRSACSSHLWDHTGLTFSVLLFFTSSSQATIAPCLPSP